MNKAPSVVRSRQPGPYTELFYGSGQAQRPLYYMVLFLSPGMNIVPTFLFRARIPSAHAEQSYYCYVNMVAHQFVCHTIVLLVPNLQARNEAKKAKK